MKLVSLKNDPNIKIENNITYYLNPDFLYLPSKGILVKQNSLVYKGMPVTKTLSSPVSGLAFGVKKALFQNSWQVCLVIENDFRELSKKNKMHPVKTNIPNILKCSEEADQYLYSKFKNQTKFTNIIISAIDDEPYVYNNIFILKENINELLEIFDELSFIYKSDNNYLVVKNIDTAIINDCLNIIGTYPNIKLTLVNDEYLLGREDFLKEKLNIKNNTLYLTTNELLALYNSLHRKDSTTILITISGNALAKNIVIRIKKYTLLKDIIAKYLNITCSDYVVIANGLMQGFLVKDVSNFVIDPSIFAINIMRAIKNEEDACINCGMCEQICPKGLDPLNNKDLKYCLDCGLCTYICPCNINLRKYIKEKKND